MERENDRINGFMLATVLDNGNEKQKGKLKLRLLCEGQEKNILEDVKVIAPFGGERYGVYCLPEVGEQVLVGFLGGCFDRPFVFGSLYTSTDEMVSESFHEKNALKRFVTKGGSVVEISDEKDQEAIRVKTPKGNLSIELLQNPETVTVTAEKNKVTVDGKNGSVKVSAEKKIELTAGSASLSMESNGNIKLKGGTLELKGNSIKLDSGGLLNMKGQSCELSGAMVSAKANGIMEIKGNITKIN